MANSKRWRLSIHELRYLPLAFSEASGITDWHDDVVTWSHSAYLAQSHRFTSLDCMVLCIAFLMPSAL